jgi:hypothetical protein
MVSVAALGMTMLKLLLLHISVGGDVVGIETVKASLIVLVIGIFGLSQLRAFAMFGV